MQAETKTFCPWVQQIKEEEIFQIEVLVQDYNGDCARVRIDYTLAHKFHAIVSMPTVPVA